MALLEKKKRLLKWYHVSYDDMNKIPKTAINLAYRINTIADYLKQNKGVINRNERRSIEKEYDKTVESFLRLCIKCDVKYETLQELDSNVG